MKDLRDMSLEELKKEMTARGQDAFYSAILIPITDEDRAHNKALSDAIAEVEEIMLTKYFPN